MMIVFAPSLTGWGLGSPPYRALAGGGANTIYQERNLLKVDGHDDAILGVGYSSHREPMLVYSVEIILKNLTDMGMDFIEAREFFDFNILGSYSGLDMPIFLEPFQEF